MKNILNIISDILYPVKCVCCGSLDDNGIICKKCMEILKNEALVKCGDCNLTPDLCKCRKILYIDAVFYKYFYIGNKIKRALYRYKVANLYYINEFFAKDMFTLIEKSDRINIADIDFVTNVPRKTRLVRSFGYDQTKNLAKLISKYSGIKYKPLLNAVKSKDYKEQKKLSYQERVLNVRNKFIPNIADNISIHGKNILIIDDIVTTGSTLSECARVLKNMGAGRVYALCAASAYCEQPTA